MSKKSNHVGSGFGLPGKGGWLFCVAFFICSLLYAQQPKALLKELEAAKSPKERVGLLVKIADKYASSKDCQWALEHLASAMKINEREAIYHYEDDNFTSVLIKATKSVSLDSLKMAFNDLPKDALSPSFYNLFAYQAIYDLDPDYAIALGQKALDLSKVSRNTMLEGESHYNIGQMMYYTDKTSEDETHFLAALKIFQAIPDTLGIIKSKQFLADMYRWDFRLDVALQYINEALALAIAINDLEWQFQALSSLHVIKRWEGEYGEAQRITKQLYDLVHKMENSSMLHQAQEIEADLLMNVGNHRAALPLLYATARRYEAEEDFSHLPVAYSRLAVCLWSSGVYDSAMIYLHQSIDYAKKYHNEYMFRQSLMDLALLHFDVGDKEMAMEYSSQMNQHFANADFTDLPDFIEHQFTWNILFFEKTGELDSALYYAEKALATNIETGITGFSTSKLLKVGKLYMQLGQPKMAMPFFQKALQTAREIGQNEKAATSLLGLAEAAIDQDDFPAAISYARLGLELAEHLQLTHLLPDIYKSLSSAYAKSGDFRMAFQYQSLLDQLQDSLLGFIQKQQMAKYASLYRLKEKSLENERLQVEKEKNDMALRKRTSQAIALVGVIFFLVIGAYLFKERAKLRAENKLRKDITRDIHDDVGGILNNLKMTIKEMQEEKTVKGSVDEVKLINALQLGNQAMESLKNLIWSMDKPKATLKSLAEEVKAFTHETLAAHQAFFQLNITGFGEKRALDPKVYHHLLMIYKEALQNAVKHGDQGNIAINFSMKNSALYLVVKNGISATAAAGPGTYKGLQNMRERAALLGGEVVIDKTDDCFEVQVKVKF